MSDQIFTIHDEMGRQDIAGGLGSILQPNGNGAITFGSKAEPMRESQAEILSAIYKHIESGQRNGYVVAPGGIGKTRIGFALSAATAHHRRKTLFVVDRQDSLDKFAKEARELLPQVPIGEVYAEEKTLGDITFITINSLRNRVRAWQQGTQVKDGAPIDPKTFDMALWDEAHMYLTKDAQELKKEFNHCINIGFTATPKYYDGKEVGDVFGPLIAEIPYDLARQRGEVNRCTNYIVNSGITTGLKKLRPDQEESGDVARVSNRRDRNLIVPDLYANFYQQKPDGSKDYIAGKPALALVATINHAHDMARAINQALMPLLREDKDFRASLRANGIDPDKVKRIAAPYHSGDSDKHDAMDIDARKKVMNDFNAGRTLMLVSTKVLQQSFDCKRLQVLFDTVPRMTYVGVGQGGYRVTRVENGKPDSIVFNLEDKDRETLTFDEFLASRAANAEEGVRIEGMEGKTIFHPSHMPEQGRGMDVAPYRILTGIEKKRLLEERARIRQGDLTTETVWQDRVQKAEQKPEEELPTCEEARETIYELFRDKRTGKRPSYYDLKVELGFSSNKPWHRNLGATFSALMVDDLTDKKRTPKMLLRNYQGDIITNIYRAYTYHIWCMSDREATPQELENAERLRKAVKAIVKARLLVKDKHEGFAFDKILDTPNSYAKAGYVRSQIPRDPALLDVAAQYARD